MNPDTTATQTATTSPQYTSASFANAILTKYPNGVTSDGTPYSKLSPEELTRRIIAKYPIYKSQISPSLGEGAAGQFAGNAVRAVASPLLRVGGAIESTLDETAGRAINAVQGKGPVPTQTGAAAEQAAKNTDEGASGSLAGHVGTFAGSVAPYFSGLGEEEAGAKIASVIPQLAEKLGMKSDTLIPKVASYLTSKIPSLVTNTAIGTAQTGNLKEGFETGTEALVGQEALKGIPKVVPLVKTALENGIKGKTLDEILRTPESKLNTLSSNERKIYFDKQQENLNEQHADTSKSLTDKYSDIEKGIESGFRGKIDSIQEDNKELEAQVARSTIKEARSLKPVVLSSLRENSGVYRDLVSKEIEPARGVYVLHKDLMNAINTRFADDPRKAADLIDRLNLTEGKTSKVGEIYDQMKGLRQDISKPALQGTKVFTPDDLKTTDAINVLSQYLRENHGVDFSEANKFWSQYAPIRNKIIKNIQPFTPSGAESGTFSTFAKGIRKSIEGKDPYNEEFISEVERVLGTKIGSPETRSALEALSQGQKKEIAVNVARENAQMEAKLAKEQEKNKLNSNLSDKQKGIETDRFNVDRDAKTRAFIKKAIVAAVGLTAAKEGLKFIP